MGDHLARFLQGLGNAVHGHAEQDVAHLDHHHPGDRHAEQPGQPDQGAMPLCDERVTWPLSFSTVARTTSGPTPRPDRSEISSAVENSRRDRLSHSRPDGRNASGWLTIRLILLDVPYEIRTRASAVKACQTVFGKGGSVCATGFSHQTNMIIILMDRATGYPPPRIGGTGSTRHQMGRIGDTQGLLSRPAICSFGLCQHRLADNEQTTTCYRRRLVRPSRVSWRAQIGSSARRPRRRCDRGLRQLPVAAV